MLNNLIDSQNVCLRGSHRADGTVGVVTTDRLTNRKANPSFVCNCEAECSRMPIAKPNDCLLMGAVCRNSTVQGVLGEVGRTVSCEKEDGRSMERRSVEEVGGREEKLKTEARRRLWSMYARPCAARYSL